MTQGFLPKTIFILVFTGLLSACGGGSGGSSSGVGGTGGGSGTTAPPPAPTLTLSLVDGAGAAATQVNGNESITVRAVFANSAGDAVSGAVITFNSSIGQLSPASGTALTDSSGVATITLGAGTQAGAGTVSAESSVDGVAVTGDAVGFQTDGLGNNVGSANFTVTLALTTPNTTQTISRSNAGTATVTLTDTSGGTTNTDGALVEFTVSNGELPTNATFISGNTASVSVLAGTVPGSGQLAATITVGGQSLQADNVVFISLGDSVPSVVLTVPGGVAPGPTASTPVAGAVTSASPVVVTATVRDRFNALVQGAVVNFALTGDGRLSRMSNITNVSGEATTSLLAGTAQGFGQITASTSVGGFTANSDADNVITFETDGDEPFTGEGSSNLSIVIGLDTDGDLTDAGELSIDAATPGILFATVTQADSSPAPNTVVRFSIGEVGDLFPANGTALTNSNGLASVALTAGSEPGAATATAAVVIGTSTFNTSSLNFSTLGNAGDAVIVIGLIFNDATPGNGSNIITSSESATIGVTVEDDAGTNLPNRTAIVTTTLGTVSINGSTPASTATAITDSNGQITVSLAAGATFGSGTVSVTVGDTTEVVQFDVGVDGLQIGTCTGGTGPTDCSTGTTFTPGILSISTSPLSAGGTSTVSLVVVDANQVVVPNIQIAFSTVCGGQTPTLAEISETLSSNSQGVVTATYLATGCVGADEITATESSAGLIARGTINVLTATIGSIRFDSVNPQNIQIKGTGTSSASVIFQVLDVQGGFVEDATVSFELTTNVGGLSLVSLTGLTGAEGKATATVNAGLIPTTVRVRASVIVDGNSDGDTDDPEDFTLETLSDGLSVNTGVPDQNSFSISSSGLNIEGEIFDGTTSGITVRLADAFNNPVPNGTTVQFRTEYGSIQSSCNTVSGACSVTLQSQEPRAPTNPNSVLRNLFTDSCPTALIIDETVAVATVPATDATTDYVPQSILRVETTGDVRLVENTDYTVAADGIECITGACSGALNLRITYTRKYLDEVGAGDGLNSPTTPAIGASPGSATTPFVARTGVPCRAASRSPSTVTAGYRGGLGQLYGGRSTILAFAQGEESFVDTNGNGQYDFNESFVDLPEAFHDINEDDVFGNGNPATPNDASRNATVATCYGPQSPLTTPPITESLCYQVGGDEEEFIDFGDNDATNNLKDLDGLFNAGNGIYNGTLCPAAISSRTDTCNNGSDPCDQATEQYCTRDLINIRRDITIVISDSSAFFSLREASTGEFISSVNIAGGPTNTFTANQSVTANDGVTVYTAGNPFNVGSGDTQVRQGIGETVSLTSRYSGVVVDISDQFNGRLSTGSQIAVNSGDGGCLISNSPGGSLTDSNTGNFTQTFISLAENTNPTSGSAAVTITATTNKGIVSQLSFTCTH